MVEHNSIYDFLFLSLPFPSFPFPSLPLPPFPNVALIGLILHSSLGPIPTPASLIASGRKIRVTCVESYASRPSLEVTCVESYAFRLAPTAMRPNQNGPPSGAATGLLMLAALSQALEPSLATIAAPSDAVLGVFLVAAGPIRFLAPSAFRALD